MPKIKKGLEYFDLDTDINSDMRIKLLRAEFGIKGFGIWVHLLIQIYADEGFFMRWDSDTKLLFASDVGESGGLVDEVVKGSVKRGLFNQSVFDQFGVLTSKHIQEKYFNAIKRRTSETQVDSKYLVIPLNSDIIKGNDNIKLLNVNIIKQSRVEKSKEEESREDDVGKGFPDVVIRVANHLKTSICKWDPDHKYNRVEPSMDSWYTEIDRSMRIDGRTEEQLMYMINYIFTKSTRVAGMWQPNIQSGKKLREKFDQVKGMIKTENANRKNHGQQSVDTEKLRKQIESLERSQAVQGYSA